MEPVVLDNALRPGGHYSLAMVHGGLVFVSGLLPIDPDTGAQVHGSVADETRQILSNLDMILTKAGSCRNRVLKATVYISDIAQWGEVNRVYAEFFGEHRPARAVVPVGTLHFGFQLELEAVAALEEA